MLGKINIESSVHAFCADSVQPNLKAGFSSPWLRGALGGWQLSGISSFVSGIPMGVGLSFNYSLDTTGSTDGARPDVVGVVQLPRSQVNFYHAFNTAAFGVPVIGTVGNEGKYAFTGPGIANNDVSLFKNFNIRGERWKGQLRGEFYNILNHTDWRQL